MTRSATAGLIGFCLGIVISSIMPPSFSMVALCVLLGVVVFLITPRHVHVAVFCLALAFGFLRMMHELPHDSSLDARIGQKVTIEGMVAREPDTRERSVRLTLETDSGARVMVVAAQHTGVLYGDRITAEGELSLPRSFETGEGRTFAYDEYLALSDVRYLLSFAHVEIVERRTGFSVMATALSVKHWYMQGLGLALPEPHAGLASGITVGDKRGLGEALSETFRSTGLTHIVVLSGYNIMIVLVFLERVFRRFGARTHLVLAMSVALFFALITGFASASVRAALMAIIAVIGRITGRTYLALRALLGVACLMLIFEPRLLLYDPGFQLSVIATWGLIVIAPIIEAKLTRITERFELRTIVASTIGTQIAVLPLLLFQTGMLSIVSLPANLLVLPVVPFAMLFAFIAGVLGAFMGPLTPVIAAPAYALLAYMITAAETLARVPFATVSIPRFSLAVLLFTYVALITLVHVRISPQQPANSRS